MVCLHNFSQDSGSWLNSWGIWYAGDAVLAYEAILKVCAVREGKGGMW